MKSNSNNNYFFASNHVIPCWNILCTPNPNILSYDLYFTLHHLTILYSMCSLAVSTQDSPAVEPRSNPGSGKILMSENLRLYTTSPVVMC